MAEAPTIPLEESWPERVKSGLLYALALARRLVLDVHAGFDHGRLPRARLVAQHDRLKARVAMLEEELRIKDARMAQIAAARRPHYPPSERLAILTLRAAAGWNAAQTARRFLVTAATIASWMHRLDELGPEALVRLAEPVNRFPDFVTALVQSLRATLPSFGRRKLAAVLARAGLHLSPTTVRRSRISRSSPRRPPRRPPARALQRSPAKPPPQTRRSPTAL